MATTSHNGTTKSKPYLDYEGHSYIIDRSTNEKIHWRCAKYFSDCCRSHLHTCTLINVIVKTATEHTGNSRWYLQHFNRGVTRPMRQGGITSQ